MAKNKGGRPKINISAEDFEKICFFQPTLIEVAAYFNCSEDTIERWCESHYGQRFADVYRQKAGKGKLSLRRAQWKLALEAQNPTMLIWLGKQNLDQAEKLEQKADITTRDEDTKSLAKRILELTNEPK